MGDIYCPKVKPKLIVFDLDDTLWWPEMYMLAGTPFRRDGRTGHVFDAANERVEVYSEAEIVLDHITRHQRQAPSAAEDEPSVDPLQWKDTMVAYASRTHYPRYADQCMNLLTVGDDWKHLQQQGSSTNAGNSSKGKARKAGQGSKASTQPPPGSRTLASVADAWEVYPGEKIAHFRRLANKTGVDFKDMIFFDNEPRNCRAVATLGVTCVCCPGGLTVKYFNQGLRDFEARQRE